MITSLLLLAVLDPNVVQTTVLTWIGVGTMVLGALSGFAALVISKISQLRALAAAEEAKIKAAQATDKATALDARLDRQGVKVEHLQQAVTQVALATTPPANGASTPVEVVNKEPIEVKETGHE